MNNSIKVNLGILVLVIMVIPHLGCKKFLDRKPLGTAYSEDVTSGAVEDQVFGLYGALRNWGMTSLPYLTVHAARADDNVNSTPGDGGDAQAIVDMFQYNKDHWLVNANWDDHLGFITQASNIIQQVDSLYSTDPASLTNKGEASFMRAYAYFDMVRDYGDVPKINFRVYTADQANVQRTAASEIYDFIISDLQFAVQNLPLQWEAKYTGRVTQYTAHALLAKVYLYQKRFADALAEAQLVINSGLFGLLPHYADVFKESGENSQEVIFAVQNYESTNGSVNFSNSVTNYEGVRGSGDWDLGWGWNLPSAGLVNNAYESDDPRKGATILFSGAPDDTLNSDGYGMRLPALTNYPYWNKKAYTDPARRQATGDRFGNWLDMIIYRYADLLLVAAEAANESGNSNLALEYLNEVRTRARDGDASVLPDITSTDQSSIRTAIKKERRVELAMEWDRFYDLVRWTPATDNIDAPHVLGPLGYQDKNALLPIPQPAIDKSNGVLTQNPGY